ncbi:MAG TPA: hypothetical protein VFC65_09955 [Prolixibacteraceae bacterium]|nr:hypothetical protein [Prolixibacteraceae bacterium]
MEQNKRFEVFGTLTKTETVFTIDHKNLPGTLVFEALKPFPDYYYDASMTAIPMYLYLALEEQYPLEDILRASQKIQLDFQVSFDAGKGFLHVYDEKYDVLRVRHLKDYDLLEKLQKSFEEKGIRFLRKSKRYNDQEVKIRIIKFFSLEEIGDNIFLDKREENHAYLEIPHHLNWDEFEIMNNKVKYNWVESKFDAAKGAFYYNGKLHEVVRIYSDKIELQYLQELQKLYLDKMK